MEADKTRREMTRLVREEFANDASLVSRALNEMTERKVSSRTVQSWLIEPGKTSSRTCPAWALKALTDFLSQPVQREALSIWTEVKGRRVSAPDEFSKVYDRDGVRRATVEIDSDARALADWENASLSNMARKLYAFERGTNRYLQHIHDQQLTILRALEQAKTFDEMKATVKEMIRDKEQADAYVEQTRRAIEAGTDEFAHPDGLAK